MSALPREPQAPLPERAGDPPLWADPGAPRRDALPARADLAIAGGGIAGVAAAWHAARAGLSVVLLEAERIGARASGRNDGQVLLGLGEHPSRLASQWGAPRARALLAFLTANRRALEEAIAAERIDCAFHAEGGLRLAAGEGEYAELEASTELLATAGIAHRLLDRAALAALFPLARNFAGALRIEGEAVLDPRALVRGLAEAARRRGLRLREGARLRAIEGRAGAFVLRFEEDGRAGTLEARAVLHATAALAPELDRSGFLARRLFPFRGQLAATQPLPAELLAQIPYFAMSSHFCYEYFRRHGERLTLGGMRWSVKGEESGTTDDLSIQPRITEHLRAWLAHHLPALAGVPFERVWSGIMAGTPDGLPLVGPLPGRPGELCSLGFNGYGLGFAFRAGALAVELLAEGRSDDPAAALFAPRRFAS